MCLWCDIKYSANVSSFILVVSIYHLSLLVRFINYTNLCTYLLLVFYSGRYLSHDGTFVLKIIYTNTNCVEFDELIGTLWQSYHEHGVEHRVERPPNSHTYNYESTNHINEVSMSSFHKPNRHTEPTFSHIDVDDDGDYII